LSPQWKVDLLEDKLKAMRILLVNLAVESVQAVERALLGHGYEIIKVSSGTVEEVLTLSPGFLGIRTTAIRPRLPRLDQPNQGNF